MNSIHKHEHCSLNSVQSILILMAVKKVQGILPRQRREAAKQNLREQILAVSREIIAEEGFPALTMRKLAERIGYSAASLYLHFRNRDEIASEVSRVGYADLLTALSSATGKVRRHDPAARLRALATAYIQFGLENPQTYRLIFLGDTAYLQAVASRPDGDDPATRAYGLLIEVARDLITVGFAPPKGISRRPRAVTPTELAETLWAGMHGIVSLKLTCPQFPTASAEIMTHVMIETLLRGLEASQAG